MKKEICKICGELTVLSKHIRKHNLTTKEYYDKYLKKIMKVFVLFVIKKQNF